MVALTENRSTKQKAAGDRVGLLAASQTIFAGAILMRNASGHLTEGATATGSYGVGRAEEAVTSTTAGVTLQRFREGVFCFANSAAGDLIATADIGTVCYIVDDQTVAKTSGTNTRSPAGIVEDVDATGVWVRFDEALTRAMLS
jgi:predicted RecA/RadA family phage recombinase